MKQSVRLRPIRAEDAPLLADMFARLSPASRHARFLSPKACLTAAEVRYFTDVDHHDHEALIAVTLQRGEPVGAARFIRDRSDPTLADVAIAVVDEWQGNGVGSLLTAQLKARALEENITQVTPLILAGNHRARRLLAKLGDVSLVDGDGAATTYQVTLAQP